MRKYKGVPFGTVFVYNVCTLRHTFSYTDIFFADRFARILIGTFRWYLRRMSTFPSTDTALWPTVPFYRPLHSDALRPLLSARNRALAIKQIASPSLSCKTS